MKRLALAHVAELRRKTRELEEMAGTLETLAESCHGDARPDCPILNELETGGPVTPPRRRRARRRRARRRDDLRLGPSAAGARPRAGVPPPFRLSAKPPVQLDSFQKQPSRELVGRQRGAKVWAIRAGAAPLRGSRVRGGWVATVQMTANELDAHVGQRIRQRREALGISQGRLARHLGLTFSQVQKYEKGANRIGAGRLYLIARFLEVPVDYFFDEIVDPGAPKAGGSGGPGGAKTSELAALDDAFLSIKDNETRRSVLSLVCSLAASAAPDRARPRRGIA